MAKTLLTQIGFQPALPRHSREACSRKRGERDSAAQAFGNASLTDRIPTCAEMTMAREWGHQVRNLGNLPLRDVKNDDRSDYVYENKGTMTICHAVLQTDLQFAQQFEAKLPVFRHKKKGFVGLKGRKGQGQ
jgi:hypothetical protein